MIDFIHNYSLFKLKIGAANLQKRNMKPCHTFLYRSRKISTKIYSLESLAIKENNSTFAARKNQSV